MLDALVIGAGPAGLATAAMLRKRGATFRIVDREGAIGGAYTRMNPDVELITPSRFVAMPGFALSAPATYLPATAYRDYLGAYAAANRLVVETATVDAVHTGSPHRIDLRCGDRVEHVDTRAVVVATGMFDFPERPTIVGTANMAPERPTIAGTASMAVPVRPTIPGANMAVPKHPTIAGAASIAVPVRPTAAPAVPPTIAGAVPVIHSAEWRTEMARPGLRVVVVGGATSAVEIAEIAARHDCRTTLATRKLRIAPQGVLGIDLSYLLLPIAARVRPRKFCEGADPPPGTDRGFAELRRRGAIAVRPALQRIDGNAAVFADGTRAEVDLVVLATGYRFDSPFLPRTLARTPRGAARCKRNESVSHPGVYFVGSPCARTAASQFLYGIARDAVDVAAAIAR